MRSVTILIVGDEILSGEVTDENGPFLLRRLNAAGARVRHVAVVPDDEDAIVGELSRLRAVADAVVVSGGIGPTHDDVTRGAVARALGLPLERHAEAEAAIRGLFRQGATEADLGMALLPRGASLVVGPRTGTIGFRVAGVYAFPGVPFLLQDLTETLAAEFTVPPLHRHEIVTPRTEGEIAVQLAACQGRATDVRIGSYPVFRDGRWHVRVVLRAEDPERLLEVAREVSAIL